MAVPTTRTDGRPLKVGIVLPDTEREMGGQTAGWADLLAMARAAEGAGSDSVWVTDHLLFRLEGQGEPRGLWERWSLLAALAATTERVALGPLVTCAGYRHPVVLAQTVDTIEEISGGRLILGLGAGWPAPEYRRAGIPFDRRVSRFAEAFAIVHGLLREGRVDLDGVYYQYQARDCELRPRGPRPQGPPILIGSNGARMLRLVARGADLWNAWACNRVENLAPLRRKVDAACLEVGRDPTTLGRSVSILVGLSGAVGRRREKEAPMTGSPRSCRRRCAPPPPTSPMSRSCSTRTPPASRPLPTCSSTGTGGRETDPRGATPAGRPSQSSGSPGPDLSPAPARERRGGSAGRRPIPGPAGLSRLLGFGPGC